MSIDEIIERQMEINPGRFPSSISWKYPLLTILIALIVNSLGIYVVSTPMTEYSYIFIVIFILNITWVIIGIVVIQLSISRITKKKLAAAIR